MEGSKADRLTARLFDVQRFSLDDGPGIRTVVFFKGCNMSCSWCHNPESIRPSGEIYRTGSLCTGCLRCVEICPREAISYSDGIFVTESSRCDLCGECISECPASCIRQIGYESGLDELMDIIKKDEAYYEKTGGGVTFSGGEPTLQYDFLAEALRLCSEKGINTVLDTNGTLEKARLENLLPFIDTVLLDVKHTDRLKHREFTGIDNAAVLETLAFLPGKANLEVRVPVIPSFNETEAELKDIIETVRAAGVSRLRLLPYHVFGIGKYRNLGREYKLEYRENLEKDAVEKAMAGIDTSGLEFVIDVR